MDNIIKMDFYRLVTSKSFKVSLLIVAFLSFISKLITKGIYDLVSSLSETVAGDPELEGSIPALAPYPDTVELSGMLCSPFGYTILIVLCLIIAVGFAYSDIANGFIKNIAGQLPSKGYTVISKFVVISILNGFYMISALISSVLGEAVIRKVVIDSAVPQGICTFFLKYLLLQALCTIILFFAAGIKQKTAATVVGVVLGSGLLGLAYMGLNMLVNTVFKTDSFNVNEYAPDSLLISGGNITALNALIVSGVIIAVFLPLTVKIFNKTDVK